MYKGYTITDARSGATATILPDYGFNCVSWQVNLLGKQVELLDTLPGFHEGNLRPSSSGIPILFPFPNRIRNGEFNYRGRNYQLPKNNQNKHAIHGFVLDRPFRVIAQSENSLTGSFRLSVDAPERLPLWPADFELQVTYTVESNSLCSAFRVINPAESTGSPLPWGLGTHAYFKLPLAEIGSAADCMVFADASDYWELSENLPTGRIFPATQELNLQGGKKYSACKFDDVLTGLKVQQDQVQSRIEEDTGKLSIIQTADSIFRHLVVFTPVNREAICMEPYTCVTDSINLIEQGFEGTGWQELPAGEELSLQIKLEFYQSSSPLEQ